MGASYGGPGTDGRTEASAKECARVRGIGSKAACERTRRDGPLSARAVSEGGRTRANRRRVSGIGRRSRLRPPCLHHRERRNFALLRLHGGDSLRAKLPLLRSPPPLRNSRTQETITPAVQARQ